MNNSSLFSAISIPLAAGKRAKEITEAIVYMICKDNFPLNIVEGKGFLKLMKSVVPHFKVPSRKTIRKLINCKYEVESEKMKNEIKATENYSLTTDIWTESGNTISYLGLTVHYLKNGSFKAGILVISELRSNHTAEYLRNVIQGLCKEWYIDLNKVVSVVTDNGMKDLFGEEKHLSCFAHCIHLVATAGLSKVPDVQAIIGKVKTIVTFFKHSVVASDKLRQLQIDHGIAPNDVLKLRKDVPTRWNSTYFMTDRFIALSNYVGSVLLQNPHSPPMLSGYELDVLREFRTVLSPLEQITRELIGQKYVTISLVIPLLNCLQTCLTGQIRETGEARSLSKSLINELKLRFLDTESNKLYAVSTLLDPRFKYLHFRDSTALTRAINEVDQSLRSSSEESIQERGISSNYEMNPNDIWSHHNSLMAKDGSINEESDTSLELRHTVFLAQRPHERNEDPLKVWSSIAAV
ncbi:hypothetical protein J437_LFUL013469 [Ladona fulva]|uniref:Zinc finger BED domain-containing protein 4 n=1 Tax=Ladona fulva TaxID=123851 RepID=A0A8K0KFR0_LADFU|nr:hypothetical protein J437_LFUL013469 [Ladona fulva]